MRSHLARPGLDWLTGFLIPLCIVGMIGSLVFFLIVLRGTFLSGGEGVLRYVVFWFLIASVWIRIIQRQYGSAVAGTPYLMALGAVMVAFIFVFTASMGGIGPQAGAGFGTQLFLNYLLVAIIWWAASAITADCTLEAADVEDGESGRVGEWGNGRVGDGAGDGVPPASAHAGADNGAGDMRPTAEWREKGAQPQAGSPPVAPSPRLPISPSPTPPHPHSSTPPLSHSPAGRRRVGRSVLFFSVPALLTFALGQRALAAAGRERDGYAMACMVIYLASAMALLALTSLSGLRLYLRLRRMRVSRAMAALWLALSAACVALVLLLSGLLPRTYGADPWGPGQPHMAGYLGRSHPWLESLRFRGDSRPTGAPLPDERGHRVVQDPQGESVSVDDPQAPGFVGDRGAPVDAQDGTLAGGSAEGQGDAETRRRGDAETRRRGDAETRRGGDGDRGRHGDGETRRQGEGETRRHGDAETRRRGEGETGRHGEDAGRRAGERRADRTPPPAQGQEPGATLPEPAAGQERQQAQARRAGSEGKEPEAPEGRREEQAAESEAGQEQRPKGSAGEAPEPAGTETPRESAEEDAPEPTSTGAPAESPPSAETAPPPGTPARLPMPDARVLVMLGALLLLLAAAYAAWRSGLLQRLAAWIGRLRGLRVKLPSLPHLRWRRPRAAEAEGTGGDPFGAPGLTAAERIERAYSGLLDYAQELGCPRFDHETPIEYGKRLPGPLQGVRREAVLLTRLYVMAVYGGHEMGEAQVTEARTAWERIRQVLEPRVAGASA